MDGVWFQKMNDMLDVYVPDVGKAKTRAGELLRAVSGLVYRFSNDGDHIAVGCGNETCNAQARYIQKLYPRTEMASLVFALWGMENDCLYEAGLGMLVEQTVKYIEAHPELLSEEARHDCCLDFCEPGDMNWGEEDDDEEDGGDNDDWFYSSRYRSQEELDLREYPPRDWRR